jgi:hypothetical protein
MFSFIVGVAPEAAGKLVIVGASLESIILTVRVPE